CDKEYIIKRETAFETKKEAALEMIRFAHEDGIPDDKTRKRVASLGLSPDVVNDLFARIEEEEKSLVQ
ncbi:MAG: hypothetical protein J6M44_09560, partial [Butyrivibrio sp.]|nr:hypothetical protein [Butyrivibrio sp.]